MKYIKMFKPLFAFWPEKQLFKFDLQLFSGEKTEDPTSKRESEARKKGQVAKSAEVNAVCLFITAFTVLQVYGNSIYSELLSVMHYMFTEFSRQPFTIEAIHGLFLLLCMVFLKTLMPLMASIFVVMIVVNVAQVGLSFNTESLMPNFDKLNPISGMQKLLSPKVLVELLKAIVKVIIVIYYLYKFIAQEIDSLPAMVLSDLKLDVGYSIDLLVRLVYDICKVMLVFALFDYGYQWWNHNQSLKMSKQEVKEEMKQTEGNPQIKSKIKQKQREMAMQRMMSEVPKANVIVTNPTHFAVALKYENDMPAPLVVAKGKDLVALKIKEIAKNNNVAIVENKPLARIVYQTVQIGDIIPPELYQAVAEVLAYVYKLKGRK